MYMMDDYVKHEMKAKKVKHNYWISWLSKALRNVVRKNVVVNDLAGKP